MSLKIVGALVIAAFFDGLAIVAEPPTMTCLGNRATGDSVVILEAGAGNGIEAWAKVQPEIARFARVCSYDRPALRRYWMGEEPPRAPSPDAVIETLNAALVKAAEPPPYVLVGHSYGGMVARLYATRFPDRVKGMVLIDSSHEDQLRRLGDPPPPLPAPGMVVNVPEIVDIVAMNDALNAKKWRADIPLVVLTRGSAREIRSATAPDPASAGRYETWLDLQRELATRSSRSEHVIAKDSGHFIQNDEPNVVIDAVRRVVARP